MTSIIRGSIGLGVVALHMLIGTGMPVSAATTVGKAETSRAIREQAIREIPFQGLTQDARKKISDVVTKPTMFRRMPVNVIDCDAKLYRFLIRHPEVVVNIWQLMGITKVTATRLGPYTLDTTDGVGTRSKVELVYGTNNVHLLYCEGNYEGPLFRRPLQGRCVLVLKSEFVERADGGNHVTNRLDVFLQVDHLGAEALTKTLHPLLGKSADINFVESTRFLERICHSAENNGPGMERLADRLDQVDPSIRETFLELSQSIYTRHQQRIANRSSSNSESKLISKAR